MSYLDQITIKSSFGAAWEAVLSDLLGPCNNHYTRVSRARGERAKQRAVPLPKNEERLTGSFHPLSPDRNAAGRGGRVSGKSKRDLGGASLSPRQNRMA